MITFICVVVAGVLMLRDLSIGWQMARSYFWWLPLPWVAIFGLDRIPAVRALTRMNRDAAEAAANELPSVVVHLTRTSLAQAHKQGIVYRLWSDEQTAKQNATA